MKKGWMILLLVLLGGSLWIAFCGYYWGWGPFKTLHGVKIARLPGNAVQYAPEAITPVEQSPLEGKTVVFLGSSITYGYAAKGCSFAEDLAAKYGFTAVKEAVSGTTLVDNGPSSYVSRLKKIKAAHADAFILQLSTNDASQNKPLGTVGTEKNMESFDTSTVAGALEYILAYAQQTWNCPVYVYSNPRYDSPAYAAMVELLPALEEKWGVIVIDLWNDGAFNAITEEQRALYMADNIHPTQAGYVEWWLPKFEEALLTEKGERE